MQIEPSEAQIGSGALPTEKIPSLAVTISADKQSDLLELEKQFKAYPNPIVARFAQQKMWLDVRSAAEFETLLDMLAII